MAGLNPTRLFILNVNDLNTPIKRQRLSDCMKKQGAGDFPGGAVVKNPPANAGDTGSIPGPGRSHTPRSN